MREATDSAMENADSISAGTLRRRKFSAEPGEHYDRVTDGWRYAMGDDLHVGFFKNAGCRLSEATRELTRLMADSAGLGAGSDVLDVGCGTGGPAVYLAKERGSRVVGISTSKVGIARAKTRATEMGIAGQVAFCVADGTTTGYGDGSFDCVWVMESSHLIPQKDLLIKECARVLRPGGTAVLCDLVLRRPIPGRPGVALYHDLMVLEEVYGKASMESVDFYIRQFEANGMDAGGQDISDQVLPTFAHWRANAERHTSRISEILGADQFDRFMRSCDIMTHLFRSGQFGYSILTGRKRG
jgi:27-O-demethylrifamycin SV methyltransferase